MKRKKIFTVFPTFFALLFLISCGDIINNSDTKGEEVTNILETGELAAVTTRSFVLSRYGRNIFEMRIIGLLDHGTVVNVGDSIIQLDPTDLKKLIIDWESNLEVQKATMEKLHVTQGNTINTLENNIKNETAAYNLKEIELESSRFETEKLRKIKELEFEQAKIKLNTQKQKLELFQIINYNDSKIQEIKVSQIEREITNAYAILPQLTIRATDPGVFQIARNWRNGGNNIFKVGDFVFPGNNMANIPELEWMKVKTYINENDFLKIKVGQKVAVRLDALANVVFDGEVSYVGKLCYLRDYNRKSRQKVFDVDVKLLVSDERLKPGMTVSCEYLMD
ncbi:hypothetical protein FACS1894123_02500 [Bacteroidia bacterium]|nr:hypothetical protein FACS1894123_02500 [Bacteroidia bacterium]